jgi:hypothetical protein
LPPSFADYLIVGPAGGPGSRGSRAPRGGPTWVARPPARLGLVEEVLIVPLGPLDDRSWPTVAERLTALASIRSPRLPTLIEAGRSHGAGIPEGWAVRSSPHSLPLAAAPGGAAFAELAGAARGAHDLHQAGWAHGDIREATVLVADGGGQLDLPLQAVIAEPPEVASFADPVDLDGVEPDRLWGAGPTRASDVYALGALLHRCLTGALLHPGLPGDAPVTAAQRALLERPRLDPRLAGPAAELVAECLDPDPGRRPPSALAVAERLEDLAT